LDAFIGIVQNRCKGYGEMDLLVEVRIKDAIITEKK